MPAYGSVPSAIAKMQLWNGSTWVNAVTEDATHNALRVSIFQQGNVASIINQAVDGRPTGTLGLATGTFIYGYNGASWDRIRTHYLSNEFTLTAVGTSSAIDFVTGMDKMTWQILTDASATDIEIKLEGSIDGTNFFELDSYTGTASTMRHVVNKPIRYIRFNVINMGDATYIKVRIFGMR